MAEAVSELIHGLVMQRYLNLRFIVVEGQIGWMSFFEYYSDDLWERHRFWTDSKPRRVLQPARSHRRHRTVGRALER
jgi:hypothetical protein